MHDFLWHLLLASLFLNLFTESGVRWCKCSVTKINHFFSFCVCARRPSEMERESYCAQWVVLLNGNKRSVYIHACCYRHSCFVRSVFSQGRRYMAYLHNVMYLRSLANLGCFFMVANRYESSFEANWPSWHFFTLFFFSNLRCVGFFLELFLSDQICFCWVILCLGSYSVSCLVKHGGRDVLEKTVLNRRLGAVFEWRLCLVFEGWVLCGMDIFVQPWHEWKMENSRLWIEGFCIG